MVWRFVRQYVCSTLSHGEWRAGPSRPPKRAWSKYSNYTMWHKRNLKIICIGLTSHKKCHVWLRAVINLVCWWLRAHLLEMILSTVEYKDFVQISNTLALYKMADMLKPFSWNNKFQMITPWNGTALLALRDGGSTNGFSSLRTRKMGLFIWC